MIKRILSGLLSAALAFAPIAASAQNVDPIARGMAAARIVKNGTTNCGTVAVSTPCLNLTQTWNAGGVTFTGLFANFTDTASASGSLLMDLQVGGSSKFSVSKTGQVVIQSNLFVPSAALISWGSRSNLTSPSDGNITLENTAGTSFGLLQLGGTSSSFPAIKKDGVGLGVRFADDSGYDDIFVRAIQTTSTTVSGLSTCNSGATALRWFVTDATVAASGNFGAAVVGGGANKVPVYCDGTSWKIG